MSRCVIYGLEQQAPVVVLLQRLEVLFLASLTLAIYNFCDAFLTTPNVLGVKHLDLARAQNRLI